MMTKLKTNKSVLKRIKVTSSGKFFIRKSGRGHFNAKNSGNKTRLKRNWIRLSKTEEKAVKRLLPYI